MKIRKYKETDFLEILTLFYETVHTINSKDYTLEQLSAWAPFIADEKKWKDSFLGKHLLVAEIEGVLVGFGDIDEMGYLDRLYVHKFYQSMGIATELLSHLEDYAIKKGRINLSVHASITAKPFFEKHGYVVEREQVVKCRGVWMVNYVMEKKRISALE